MTSSSVDAFTSRRLVCGWRKDLTILSRSYYVRGCCSATMTCDSPLLRRLNCRLNCFRRLGISKGGVEDQDWKSELLFGLSSATMTYCVLSLRAVFLFSFGSCGVRHGKSELLATSQPCLSMMTYDNFVCSFHVAMVG